jgi:bleomycin hydrolase
VDSVLDVEFGKVPLQFEVGGTIFTPVSYRDFLSIRPDDYVNITSFSHHPFYEQFVLEVPDNWANGQFYNLPISELMRCLNFSLQQGYTVEWDADVSNMGFASGKGIAIVPEKDWKDRSVAERESAFKTWEPEKTVTQEYRQQLFDSQVTTDDHLMHIVGMLDEAHGGDFYVVKNSWGEVSDLKGYVHVSDAYMRLNTISFTVHKSALPTDVLRRLGLSAVGTNPPARVEGIRKNTTPDAPQDTPATKTAPARVRPSINKTAPMKKAGSSDN